jgi:hypothetical protein
MSWEGYKKIAKHNFKDFGCPGFWVELLRLDAQPYGDRTDITDELDEETRTRLETLVAGGLANEDAMMQAALKDPDMARKITELGDRQLAKNIVDWNLTHPKTGEELPVPTEDDALSLQALPREFVAKMHAWLREDSELAQRIPKRKGS